VAHIFKPRVRERSDTEGTGNIVLEGRMFGSIAFSHAMAAGDTADIVIEYGDSFEECLVTMNEDGELERGAVSCSLHANGTVDQNHVSFAAGTKTVIMIASPSRASRLLDGGMPTAGLADDAVTAAKLDPSQRWNTGRVRFGFFTSAATGWLMFNDGTFGNVGSGADYAAADAEALFLALYVICNDTDMPLLTSAGAATTRAAQGSAATAWAAGCRLTLPKALGRAIGIAGAGSGLTTRRVGQSLGEEDHTLTVPETAGHNHGGVTGSHAHGLSTILTSPNIASFQVGPSDTVAIAVGTGGATDGASATIPSQGGGQAHNNMQPTLFMSAEIKL